jgi:hypothetical protein
MRNKCGIDEGEDGHGIIRPSLQLQIISGEKVGQGKHR